jgi:homoserine dehydrogenase
MAVRKDALRKIVALKRQSAEQKVRALQLDVEGIEAAINDLTAGLKALDEGKSGIEAIFLAQAHGHVDRVIRDIDARNAALLVRRSELDAAREALKRGVVIEPGSIFFADPARAREGRP